MQGAVVQRFGKAEGHVLHLQPDSMKGHHIDSIIMATSIFDDNGNFVTGGQKEVTSKQQDSGYESMLRSALVLKASFELEPGKYIIRQVVGDSENSQMVAGNGTVVIPH